MLSAIVRVAIALLEGGTCLFLATEEERIISAVEPLWPGMSADDLIQTGACLGDRDDFFSVLATPSSFRRAANVQLRSGVEGIAVLDDSETVIYVAVTDPTFVAFGVSPGMPIAPIDEIVHGPDSVWRQWGVYLGAVQFIPDSEMWVGSRASRCPDFRIASIRIVLDARQRVMEQPVWGGPQRNEYGGDAWDDYVLPFHRD